MDFFSLDVNSGTYLGTCKIFLWYVHYFLCYWLSTDGQTRFNLEVGGAYSGKLIGVTHQ